MVEGRSTFVFSNIVVVKAQAQFKIKLVLIGVMSHNKQGDPAGSGLLSDQLDDNIVFNAETFLQAASIPL